MGFLDHQGESEFPFAKETVFNAMLKAIPTVKGMKVDNADKLQGRIVVKAGVSLMSWGENIPILLSEIAENRTQVKITSSPKTGVMFGGAFDLGKNRKNIEQILSATSRILSSSSSQPNQSAANSETTNTNQQTQNFQQNTNMENQQIDKKWYDNKFITHLLLVIFFPVGLYALWQSRTIAKWWKITATVGCLPIFLLFGLIMLVVIFYDDTSESGNTNITEFSDPLNIGQDSIKSLIGEKVPYDKWEIWGTPETLDGTGNQYWVVYLNLANISFVSNQATDEIIFAEFEKTSAINFAKERAEKRAKQLETQFSLWDGSHSNLTQVIKQAMNDPDSYEHVETTYWDMNDHLVVMTKYRGKNAFGGKVSGMVKAKVSMNGDILEIIDQE